MNNFYASVECMLDMSLRGHPVAVGGDVENRHGIILAKNYEAKKYGVSTGEALWQAKQKCRNLITAARNTRWKLSVLSTMIFKKRAATI